MSFFHRFATIAVSLACLSTIAHAQGRAECSVVHSKILGHPVRYCAFLPPSFDQDKARRYPVLYYLHGLGDNEQSLLNSGGWDLVSELRAQGKVGDFIILAPSGGATFYVNSENGKVRYEDFFVKEFMPQMERKYRALGSQGTRGITGVSMGGYGALRLAFKYPNEFAAVSAEMPALIADPPKNMNTAPGSPTAILGNVFGSPFNRAYFERNNVFYFARKESATTLKQMKIYFSVGTNDDYGFVEGAQTLDRLLKSRGIPHEFHLYPGRHTMEFAVSHFPETVEFQWKTIATRK